MYALWFSDTYFISTYHMKPLPRVIGKLTFITDDEKMRNDTNGTRIGFSCFEAHLNALSNLPKITIKRQVFRVISMVKLSENELPSLQIH